ncbi:hypothetical protein BB558_000827 [Smittium angustum]|uniref:Glycosyl transferase family 25 domain-containing protein n=1 Tax=Smittium angustum TaxID=133377 RepID=A0A2U1IVF0_SMIAN|nr:hypothetical protein BB558_007310 [Smittium angustum]PWA03030.1 hypothetical protein BB558_000827 [Smittium angustum]
MILTAIFISMVLGSVQPATTKKENPIPQTDYYNGTLGYEKIFSISLKGRYDRRGITSLLSNCLGLNIEMVDAYNPLEDSERIQALNSTHPKNINNMSLGTLGCFVSHRSLWKRIVDNNISTALILEDDADFHIDIKKLNAQAMMDIKKYGNPDFDMLFLGSCVEIMSKAIPIHPGSAVRHSFRPYCLHGYVVTIKGAKKLLEQISVFDNPIDVNIGRAISDKKLLSYTLNPTIIDQGMYAGNSNINTDKYYFKGATKKIGFSIDKCLNF